ncbi:MAG: substrate-binding domain-containing protein [Lachnospiraceae bacterium]|nr:substrate-binding domain-containing protein [Candidatus Colinaster equi]
MATIKEIATKAGVSRGTVDRVLNNRDGVNEETARRVRAIIKELDYKPNKAGIALAAQKKKYLIGIIIFSRMNPFFDEVTKGFEQKAEELAFYGCEIVIKRVAYHPDAQLSAIKVCLSEGIQGLIITPYNDPAVRAQLIDLSQSGIPVITVNSDADNIKRLTYVGSDYLSSGKAAGALMQKMTSGTVNVGVIMGDSNILCHSQRYTGFLQQLEHDDRFNIIECHENYDDDNKSHKIVTDMLTAHPQINALFFTAAGVYGGCIALKEAGLGDKMCVITYDDVPTTIDMLKEGIITATICQGPRWQGRKSLELMWEYLTGNITQMDDCYYSELNIKIRETI